MIAGRGFGGPSGATGGRSGRCRDRGGLAGAHGDGSEQGEGDDEGERAHVEVSGDSIGGAWSSGNGRYFARVHVSVIWTASPTVIVNWKPSPLFLSASVVGPWGDVPFTS